MDTGQHPNFSLNLSAAFLSFVLALGVPNAAQAAVVRLTVTKAGTGAAGGTVKSTPAGITCGTDCLQDYTTGTSVKLTATVVSGYKFASWSNGCTGTATSCTVSMSVAKTVTANFLRIVPLTATKAGTGTVTSAPAGINCGGTCKANFNLNSNVTLTATPGAGFQFVNWTNACTGTARTCTVAMTIAKATKATFAPIPVALTVTKAGTGVGTVTSAPAGINCGTACTANFNMNSSVTLTAAASAGSKFDGWSGACIGTANTCTVAMTAAKTVTATYSPIPMGLTVNKAGTGKGSVTSAPAGIDCGATCAVSFNMNSSVTLAATPEPGSKFDGWSESCTGTAATCTVTMDAAKAVTASFSAIPATLTVTKAGSGKGSITSAPAGIDCGETCTASYFQYNNVTLTATPADGSIFERWLGACAAAGSNPSCTVTLTQSANTATASFVPATATPSVTTYQYDPMGNLTQVQDPLGNISKTEYDSLGQAVRQLEPDAVTPGSTEGQIDTVYDALGQVKEVIDPRNLSTRYSRDNLGNLLSLTSPDSGLATYTYDEAGNLKTKTDARGKLSTYSYDRENRLTQAAYDDQTLNYTWDSCANGKGRLCAIATPGNSVSFGYDLHGRLTGKSQTTGAVTLSLSQRYDAQGQLDQSTTPGGNTVGYLWLNGRLDAITVNGQPVIGQILYEPDGQIGGWDWGNGTVSDRFYDLNGRPVAISLGFDALGQLPATRSLYYDAASRVAAIIDDLNPGVDASYAYDGLGRLTGSSHGAQGENTFDYAYDLSGNRTGKIVDGTANEAHTINAGSNRLQQKANGSQTTGYSYDAAGNLIGDGSITYGYDAQGRKTSAAAPGLSASYTYNGLGQRVKKTVNGQTTLYFYDGQGHLLGEYNAAGQALQETLWLGDLPIAVIKPAAQSPLVNVYYVHADHLGAPRAVIRPADNKAVWTWEGEAFGNTPANNNPSGLGEFAYNLRFPGQVHDQETGLYYNYFRDYDPGNGRYTTSDPIGLAGGINTYAYVSGNPVNAVDPKGENAIWALAIFALEMLELQDSAIEGIPGGSISKGGTYVLKNEIGDVMRTGRTKDLARRECEHARDPDLKDYIFEPVYRTDNYAQQRGLEELLNKTYNPPLDKILPIGSRNPNAQAYRDAAQQYLNSQ